MRPPDWLIDDILMAGYVYTLTGNTGHGKTSVALLMAYSVATGNGFAGKLCQQGSVVFFAGENAENVRLQWVALCSSHGVDPKTFPVYWYDGVFDVDKAREQLDEALGSLADLRLIVIDSLQAFFMGEDDSQNMPMFDMAVVFREMVGRHPDEKGDVRDPCPPGEECQARRAVAARRLGLAQ